MFMYNTTKSLHLRGVGVRSGGVEGGERGKGEGRGEKRGLLREA